jgi:hypothetical protein
MNFGTMNSEMQDEINKSINITQSAQLNNIQVKTNNIQNKSVIVDFSPTPNRFSNYGSVSKSPDSQNF